MSVLQDAITELQTQIQTLLPGLNTAPYSIPSADPYPFLFIYLSDGEWAEAPAGSKTGLHTICVELHIVHKKTPTDMTEAMAYSESIPNLIFKRVETDGLGGNVQTIRDITYTFGNLGYGSAETVGFRFKINGVKIQSAIT